ncbi:MAG: ATP-binding protein [Methanosarcinaceae archaeon]|nr:ATP-binding protein [Methanosarcinaceae archaeon]
MEPVGYLKEVNEWWMSGSVDPIFLQEYQRDELQQLIELLDRERITAVIGPRRVGKTTLMYQLIDHLLRSGIKKEHVLFISMDDPLVKMMDDPLKTIIDEYLEKVIKKPIREVEQLYVFIDEIHFLPDWTLWLKRYYDLKYNIKFIVTSSSATHLLKHSKESLVGRITELKVMPLNFRDFVKFKGRSDLLEPYSKKDIFNLDVKDTIFELTKFENELVLYFNEYILSGGYPEYHSANDIRTWQNLLVSDVVEKTIYRDIATLYKVKTPQYLENILTYIAQNNCQTTSHNGIAQALSISTDTVINMVYYLESTYFIGSLSLFSKNVKKRIRSNRKLFVIDSGLCNALLKTRSIKDENIGLLVESVVNSNLLALKESSQSIDLRDISYFTDKQKHEVDIVLDIGGKVVPLEVKYQNNIYNHDFKNLHYFMDAQDLGFGVIVTKNLFEMKKDILCIPVWMFLLIFTDQVSYNLD